MSVISELQRRHGTANCLYGLWMRLVILDYESLNDNFKGCETKPLSSNMTYFPGIFFEKTEKMFTLCLEDFPAEIRNRNFLNTNLKTCRFVEFVWVANLYINKNSTYLVSQWCKELSDRANCVGFWSAEKCLPFVFFCRPRESTRILWS